MFHQSSSNDAISDTSWASGSAQRSTKKTKSCPEALNHALATAGFHYDSISRSQRWMDKYLNIFAPPAEKAE